MSQVPKQVPKQVKRRGKVGHPSYLIGSNSTIIASFLKIFISLIRISLLSFSSGTSIFEHDIFQQKMFLSNLILFKFITIIKPSDPTSMKIEFFLMFYCSGTNKVATIAIASSGLLLSSRGRSKPSEYFYCYKVLSKYKFTLI